MHIGPGSGARRGLRLGVDLEKPLQERLHLLMHGVCLSIQVAVKALVKVGVGREFRIGIGSVPLRFIIAKAISASDRASEI